MFLLIMIFELLSNSESFSHVSGSKRLNVYKNFVLSLKGLLAPTTRPKLAPIQKQKYVPNRRP
jgi:hypothetical protein